MTPGYGTGGYGTGGYGTGGYDNGGTRWPGLAGAAGFSRDDFTCVRKTWRMKVIGPRDPPDCDLVFGLNAYDEDLDDEDFDDGDFDDGDDEALALIGRFGASLARLPWFGHVGARLDRRLVADARGYLDALGCPEVHVGRITGWADAAAAAESFDWDHPAWEAEEQLRAGLTAKALAQLGEFAFEVAQAHIASRAVAAIEAAIKKSAALWEVDDEALLNAALGAAVQASHHAGLVLLAGEVDHPFAFKFRLYEHGRWPIGIAGLTLNIF